MKNILKEKAIIISAIIYIVFMISGYNLMAKDSEVERVSNELIEMRAEWQIKEDTIIELRSQLEKYTTEKLNLEPLIREKQAELDSLVGKK